MAVSEAVLPVQARTERIERWFFVSVGIFVLVLNIASFGPSLVEPSNRTVPLPLTTTLILHALVSLAWLLLFAMQATLVATGRTSVHRQLGVLGIGLAVLFVITGWNASIEEARRGFDLSGDLVPKGTTVPPSDLLLPITLFVQFALMVAVAFWYRRRPEVHKRVMVLALLVLTGAPIAHLTGHWEALRPLAGPIGAIAGLSLPALIFFYDKMTRGRVHPVSWWGYALSFLWTALTFGLLGSTQAWRDVTAWLLG